MNTNTVNKMYGVVNGYFRCNNDRVDDLNNRISERNIPSKSLQPQYSIRPVATKYGYMQVLDQYKKPTIPLNNYKSYSPSTTFNPGSARSSLAIMASSIFAFIAGPPSTCGRKSMNEINSLSSAMWRM